MTTITVNAATHDDLDALVASVAGLFLEDAGRHDPLMDLDWPKREGGRLLFGPHKRPGLPGGGVGGLLVRHFFAWARDRGAPQASVTAFAANDAAQRLYARHGFAPHNITSRAPV